MKIMITGSSGFIGRHLNAFLTKPGIELIGLSHSDIDVCNLSQLESDTLEMEIDTVVHLAGRSGILESWQNPREFYLTNVIGTQQVLEYCRKNGADLVYVSTFMYGESETGVYSESSLVNPISPYGHSKLLGENICEFYADQFGVKSTILRPFNIYGPGQSAKFLIPHIIAQVESEQSDIVLKDLSPTRDYIYVADFVSLIWEIVRKKKYGYLFNVGTGYGHNVERVAEMIQGIWGTNKVICTEQENGSNVVSMATADISNARESLGWAPKFSLADGLREIYSVTHN